MLDIRFIRENPEKVKQGCQKKQVKVDVDRILLLDKKRRNLIQELDKLRSEQNRISSETKAVVQSHEVLPKDRLEELEGEGRENKKEIKNKEIELKKIDEEFNALMVQVPNLPLDDVPIGKDESENKVLREKGKKPKFSFKNKDYLEIAQDLDLIDVKRAAKVSGTRFGYLKNEAALLELALINFAFNKIIKQGFIPVIPPVMIKSETMEAMGYIATKKDLAERYFFEKDNLFLVGTAEQSIGPMHKDEIFEEKDLPKRYLAFSTCFREEAGSYGKDTKGILRVHQFDKIEMFSFCNPEISRKEHEFFLNLEEKLMKELNLPYQVVKNCSGDMAFPTAIQYDIETWIPSEDRYRETHSTSNCTDFQARRLNIRYRDKSGKLNFVHTINGTAFAIGRTIIAIIENYQQKDGSVLVPKVLQKYIGFKIISKK
ncbi:serine--tRNA ligase [Candidatus Parcubacteria bacterium]|nr:serine--tRNA ligase [Candidatus Parcubacteria bacterium]